MQWIQNIFPERRQQKVVSTMAVGLLLLSVLILFQLFQAPLPWQAYQIGLPLATPVEGSDVDIPPEKVKALIARGIRTVAVLDESDTVRGVVSLHEDGTCQTCKYIGNPKQFESFSDVSSNSAGQLGLSCLLPIGTADAAVRCRNCGCPSGKCKYSGASCCNC